MNRQPSLKSAASASQGPPKGIRLTLEVLGKREIERELARGYAIGYPRGRDWERELDEFCTVFRAGHPSFTAKVVTDSPDRRLWLHIEGPEGAREYLEATLKMSSHEPASWKMTARWRFRRATALLRVLPDFLIIGAARSGTTSLYWYLATHPDVAPACRKEIGFFDRGFGKGLLWYRAHFPTIPASRRHRLTGGKPLLTGEATPEYLLHPQVPGRVAETLPNTKLIVLLRNPVERAYSHYHLQIRNGFESLSFEEAVEREEERLDGVQERVMAGEDSFSKELHFYSYLTRGVYADQLANWLRFFPRERLLILVTEEFHRQRAETFGRVLEFLDLSPWEPKEFPNYHRAPRTHMNPATRKRLEEYFAPHNRRLYELLGQDLGWDAS